MSDALVIGFEACPICQSKGADAKGNNRALYDDGGHFCFACGDFNTGRPGTKYESTATNIRLPMHTVESILAKRHITPATIKEYDISCEIDESSNQLYVKFPIHDVNGVETNAQYRAVDTSTGSMLKDIKFASGKIKLPLMGWRLVTAVTKTIYICEGLTDALILRSFLGKSSDVAVLGMTTATAAKRVASHILAYAPEKRVVLCFDNDDAGASAHETFVQTIEKHESELNLCHLKLPKEHKDIGDWIASSTATKEQLAEAVSSINLVGLLGSVEISERLSDYLDGMSDKIQLELSFSPSLSDSLRLMPGKLVGIIGGSGEGKSTFAEHLVMEALQQKLNVFAVSQEMLPEEFAIKLLRMVRNQPLDSPKFVRTLNKEEKLDILAQTLKLTKLLNTTDSFGDMSVDAIDRHLHKLTSVGMHPSLVIVDHLLAITQDEERGTIMKACKGLKDLARQHETCIILLSHISKQPKGKGIQQPSLNSAYGSSGLPIYCDSVVGVASDKNSCTTMVETVKLERMGGTYANVTFNYADYILTEVQKGANVDYNDDNKEEINETVYY